MSICSDGSPVRLRESDCVLGDLVEIISQPTSLAAYPHASDVRDNVLIYDSATLVAALARDDGYVAVESELVRALADGPGVVVFSGAYPDRDTVDRASALFGEIIAEQRAASVAGPGDHFAAPGQNDRVWNALQKLAGRDPDTFVRYYANDLIATVCRAWLGPGYQITSQINVVNPGGQAQSPHRDYHLGLLPNARLGEYPAHVHRLAPVLTLQGAVAHSVMPIETGPTMYLPHSQKYLPGYLAWRQPAFASLFAEHHVQLPLEIGDAVFFNPAVLHAAGHNRTETEYRMANLLQISSAFGRPMEAVDRRETSLAIYPALLRLAGSGADQRQIDNVIAAAAEGYAYPTNLDLDHPADDLAPPTQANLITQAVADGWAQSRLEDVLATWHHRRVPS